MKLKMSFQAPLPSATPHFDHGFLAGTSCVVCVKKLKICVLPSLFMACQHLDGPALPPAVVDELQALCEPANAVKATELGGKGRAMVYLSDAAAVQTVDRKSRFLSNDGRATSAYRVERVSS